MPHAIAVVGNPNCGKTTLFNALTGASQKVGNWPGVTVEKKVGRLRHDGETFDLVDLPGIYMIGGTMAASQDERVARDYILSGEPRLVVNILDAFNLERNLYLTCQLLEMGVPVVVALNMMDLAGKSGIVIDVDALSAALDCPVVPIVASRQSGLDKLRQTIAAAAAAPVPPRVQPTHADAVAKAVDSLVPAVTAIATAQGIQPRWAALRLLEGDILLEGAVPQAVRDQTARLAAGIVTAAGDDADIIIADGRYRFIAKAMGACFHQPRKVSAKLTGRIDRVVLNRFLGIPIFLLMMYLMFLFTINIGGAFIDFFDQTFAAIMVDGLGEALTALDLPESVVVMAKGLGTGIQTVSTFIPIIACLFLFLSFLEDSGYMARAAFVMDRAMRAIGLPGKSFVPMIVGFGCNVPAIMATRTLENRRDRILTALMAPFMSCGARLPVFALFAAAFFPSSGQNVVFGLYLVGLAFAVLTGLILKSTLLQGQVSHFVMELPPYHLPTLRTVLLQAWHRLREFIFRAGQVIVPIVMVLSFFNALGTDGSFGKENSRESVLSVTSQGIIPLFKPMGLTEENWPAAVGLFTGLFAKEAIVGTLNTLYAQAAEQENGAAPAVSEEAPASLGDKLAAAVQTVPVNLAGIVDKLADPLGLDVGYITDEGTAAEELKVQNGTFGAMASRFGGTAAALAYMVLILLYTPCVAALGAIRHETSLGWTVFSTAWNTVIGYLAAVAVYQAGTFATHPATAVAALSACAATLAVAVAIMHMVGRAQARRMNAAMPAE